MSDELVLEKKSKKSKKTLDLDAVTDEVADLDLTKAKKEKKKKKDKGDGDASGEWDDVNFEILYGF